MIEINQPAVFSQYVRSAATFFKTLLLPPRCLSCGLLVASENALCAECFSEMKFIENPLCEVTGAPMAYDLKEQVMSATAIAHPPVHRKMRAACLYTGTAKRLVVNFKFFDHLELADRLAHWMANAGAELLEETDVIVPVPLHRFRFLERRFNQSAELAKGISRRTGKPVALNALQRIRPTKQQVDLDLHERVQNVEGAFVVPSSESIEISGRRVLLIDDVMTTGATASACTRALLRENATYVDVLSFAMVVSGGHESP